MLLVAAVTAVTGSIGVSAAGSGNHPSGIEAPYIRPVANQVLVSPKAPPVSRAGAFEGNGTAADPYLINKAEDLILLATLVNSNIETPEGYSFAMAYLGKYFALTSDIDLGSVNFTPIGSGPDKRFGGHIDGRGHTIKNLVSTDRLYNCFVGFCDENTTVKNITFDSPVLKGSYGCAPVYYCGYVENVHTINPKITNSGMISAGIVGLALKNATNCSVKGGEISAAAYCGGAIAEVEKSCSNISVEGTVVIGQNMRKSSAAPCGGVVANMLGDGYNLHFSGVVKSGNDAEYGQELGGVAGRVVHAKLTNSFAAGLVKGDQDTDNIGGVVGFLAGTIENCYSAGRVHSPSNYCGGLVGYVIKYTPDDEGEIIQPKIINSYTSASVFTPTNQYDTSKYKELIGEIEEKTSPVIENIYYDKLTTNFYSTRYGSTTEEMTSSKGLTGLSSEVWQFTEGYYPRLKASADSENAKYSATAFMFKEGDSFEKISSDTKINTLGENTRVLLMNNGSLSTEGHYSRIENGMIKVGSEFGVDTLYITNGNAQSYRYMGIAPIPFEGNGTEASPYLLKTKEDLLKLGEVTTVKQQKFAGIHFALASDIDLANDTIFDGISADPSKVNCEFQGIFDGRGHFIHNMSFANRLVWSTPATETTLGTLKAMSCRSYGGLFGRIGAQGIVKNVNIAADCRIELFANSAAIAGMVKGRVENCRNYADVTGYSCLVGGIAGVVETGGVVTDCYNAGIIRSSYTAIGGIAGQNSGLVSNCVNTGSVKLETLCTNFKSEVADAGGIAGRMENGEVINSINYAPVLVWLNESKKGTRAGGIVASATSQSDKVSFAVNVGNVLNNEAATCGAIAGDYAGASISNVYYDKQTLNPRACANVDIKEISPALTSFLTSGKALEGFDASIWDFTAGIYPTLKKFKDESMVKTARVPLMNMSERNAVSDVKGDIILSEKATWQLEEGTAFKIEGNTVKAPGKVEEKFSQMLTGTTADGFVVKVILCAVPEIPVTGEGTEASPYLIKTTSEWNALSKYILSTVDNMEGKYIKLATDLDFTSETETTTSLYSDGLTAFQGTFDGGNHTIKGVKTTQKSTNKGSLFGILGNTGVIKNLTLEGVHNSTYLGAAPLLDKMYGKLENVKVKSSITTTKAICGGIVTYAYGGATFENVSFAGKINSSEYGVGGLVAQAMNGCVNFKDCTFEGFIGDTKSSVTAFTIYVGGFIYSASGVNMDNCVSIGEIMLSNTMKSKNVAGFIASCDGTKDSPNFIFNKCHNFTNIQAGGLVAGIATGCTSSLNSSKNIFTFTDCSNHGNISATSSIAMSATPTAGLLCNLTPGSSFTRCSNFGNISSDKNNYVAGISAYYYSIPTEENPVIFTDCRNSGTIINLTSHAAGIYCYVNGSFKFENCSNTGAVNAQQLAGGIVCTFEGKGPQIINSYNTGDITTSMYRSGGIVCYGTATDAVVKGCWNVGKVMSTHAAGGNIAASASRIGGIAAECSASFENCYNLGTVKGNSVVAGIVALPVKDKTQIISCYNAGKIDCPQDTCGSIAGVNLVNNPSVWTANNKLENSYYLNENTCSKDTNSGAKALSRKELAALDMGEGFVSLDAFTHPIAKAFADNEVAAFHAADVIFGKEDTADKVTSTFNVGGGGKVVWSSDCKALSIKGNKAEFTNNFEGDIMLKATAGVLVKEYKLSAKVTASSAVDDVAKDKEIQTRRYYTPAGMEIFNPQAGQTVIVVTTYVDGTSSVSKAIVK